MKFTISKFGYVSSKLVNDTLGRNARSLIIGVFIRILPVLNVRTSPFRISTICNIVSQFVAIHKDQGMKGLIIRLKAATVSLQQAIGGHVLKDISPLGSRLGRTQGGLPLIIPSQDRALIRAGDHKVIKLYLTIFNLYRVLEMPGRLKLHTITGEFTGDKNHALYKAMFRLLPEFAKLLLKLAGNRLHTQKLYPEVIPRSGPGTAGSLISSNPLVLLLTAQNLARVGLDRPLKFFLRKFDNSDHIPGLMSGHTFVTFSEACKLSLFRILPSTVFPLGRLGFKDEAAGKVRVFAMVDAWTQWALAPLHDEIFRILKFLPADGTFNQMAPVLKYTEWPNAYSLDLTAATDRLPMDIQVALMGHLFGEELARNWQQLLVDRDYLASNSKYRVNTVVRYAVGQPMGALSSWASLALIHHAIVNISAWESGKTPIGALYTNYAVLGDDLVIGDYEVMRVYLALCRALGVEIGLHKSLMSTSGVAIEFAKRTLYKGLDVSPVPLDEFFSANTGLPNAMAFAHKYGLTLPTLLKAFGFGFNVLGSLYKFIGKLNGRVRLLYMAYQVPQLTASEEDSYEHFLSIGNPKAPVNPDLIQAMISNFMIKVGERLERHMSVRVGALIGPSADNYMKILLDSRLIGLLLDTMPAGPVGFVDPLAPKVLYEYANPLDYLFSRKPEDRSVFQPFTFWVAPSQFAEVKDTLVEWRMTIYKVIMMQYYSSEQRREEQLKELIYQASLFPRMRVLSMLYPRFVTFLKALDGYSMLNYLFVRDEAEPRIIKDSVHLRLWRAWSKVLAMGRASMKNTPKEGSAS